MSKVLKVIGFAALAVGTILLPATGAVLAAFGVATGGVTTATAIALGVGVAASIGGSALAKKPSSPQVSSAAVDRLNANIVVNTPRKSVAGITAMNTDIRDQEYTGAAQDYLQRFIVVAAHRCETACEEVWLDDKLAWSVSGGLTSEYVGYLSVNTVNEGSAGNAINISARMGDTRRYTGCAYVLLGFKLTGNDSTASSPFAQTVPTRITIRGKGALFYDPRLDSTVAGGSGSHRADDQATWAWDDDANRNPALTLLFYLLGWRINGLLSVGLGIPPERIDLESFITAANLCDEPVNIVAGGTEPRYRCDTVWSEGDEPEAVISMIKATMNADLDDVGGKLRLTVLHNDLGSPIAAFTADNLYAAAEWSQTPSLDATFNVVRGVYTDASDNSLYQTPDYPEVSLASVDGIDRIDTFNLVAVQSASQAQRLAKQRLQRQQYGGELRTVLDVEGWKVLKNDVVTLTLPVLWSSPKLFRVSDIEFGMDGNVPVVLREEHEDIYAWDEDEAPAVVATAPTLYDRELNPIIQAIEVGLPAIIANTARKGTVFPNAADSLEDQLFIRTDLDNRLFIRTAGDGLLYNDGDLYLIGGDPIEFSVWEEVSDVRIIDALADAAQAQADAAQAAADAAEALAEIDDIISDGILSANEKPRIIQDYTVITSEQAGIDAQATALGITTEKTAYDTDVSDLTAYLATLTTPVLWSNLSGNTTIVGATFRGKFEDVYVTRQALLNKISAVLKGLANAAQTDATSALTQLTNIASDNMLTKGEKPEVITRWAALYENWYQLDAKATAISLPGSEQANADASVAALFAYLNGLSPDWDDVTADTMIVGSTFRTNWETAYADVAALQAAIQGLPGADAITITPLAAITVPATAGGVPKGAIDGFTMNVLLGPNDVTASASYAIVDEVGVSGATHSGAGVFTGPTGMSAATGYVEVSVTVGAYPAMLVRQVYQKQLDGPAYARAQAIPSLPSSTTYAQMALLTLLMGPNGTLSVGGGAQYTSASVGGVAVEGYYEYQINGGGWSTLAGSTFTGTDANVAPTLGTWSKLCSVSGASIGLSAQATVQVRLMARTTNSDTVSAFGGSVFEVEWTG
jgi:hypothetical protein